MEDWWTYELCYQKALRQYHKGPNDALEAQYVLGRWQEQEQQDADAVQVRRRAAQPRPGWLARAGEGAEEAAALGRPAPQHPRLAPPPRQVDSADVSGATPYVAHRYAGGDVCELTGQERSVEVRFTCGHGAADTLLTSVREPASCTYVVTIATPRLCKHPGFQAAPREPALITCHRMSEAEEEAQCGGGGEAAAAEAYAAGEQEAADEGVVEDDAYGDAYGEGGHYPGMTPQDDEDDPYADPNDLLHDEL